MTHIYKHIFFILGVILLASCSKENLDTDITTEEEVVTEIVSCTIGLVLEENNPGELTSTITDGTAPFTYSWSNGEITENITVDVSGTYTLVVVDAEDCTTEASIEFIEEDDCNGFETVIGMSGTNVFSYEFGGTTPFSYSWSNGETIAFIPFDGSDVYEITVTDDTGCTATATIDITLPCAGFFPLPYYSETVGDVGTEIAGGTPPYFYEWSTGETTQSTEGPVDPGTYTVTITDSNGCVEVGSITVP